MAISMKQSQTLTERAELLYDFLPGKPRPYADQMLSFPGVAAQLDLAGFWQGGSRQPAERRFQLVYRSVERKFL